jgi:hypothetical protein
MEGRDLGGAFVGSSSTWDLGRQLWWNSCMRRCSGPSLQINCSPFGPGTSHPLPRACLRLRRPHREWRAEGRGHLAPGARAACGLAHGSRAVAARLRGALLPRVGVGRRRRRHRRRRRLRGGGARQVGRSIWCGARRDCTCAACWRRSLLPQPRRLVSWLPMDQGGMLRAPSKRTACTPLRQQSSTSGSLAGRSAGVVLG